MIRYLRELARDQKGVAAVEFAMLLPLMLTMYLGSVELSQGIAADRKITLTARAVSDLASRVTTISNGDMTNMLQASSAVMSPFSASALVVTVSLVTIDASSKATVTWSDSLNGSPRSKGSSVTLPSALLVPNTALVWSEVAFAYKPAIGYMLTGTVNLKDQMYMRPRLSDSITRTST